MTSGSRGCRGRQVRAAQPAPCLRGGCLWARAGRNGVPAPAWPMLPTLRKRALCLAVCWRRHGDKEKWMHVKQWTLVELGWPYAHPAQGLLEFSHKCPTRSPPPAQIRRLHHTETSAHSMLVSWMPVPKGLGILQLHQGAKPGAAAPLASAWASSWAAGKDSVDSMNPVRSESFARLMGSRSVVVLPHTARALAYGHSSACHSPLQLQWLHHVAVKTLTAEHPVKNCPRRWEPFPDLEGPHSTSTGRSANPWQGSHVPCSRPARPRPDHPCTLR